MSADRMISHERAAELLPWLLNGTLQAEERAAVLEHARSCVTCRRDLDELDNIRAAMTAAAEAAPDTAEPTPRHVDAVLREAKRGRLGRAMGRVRRRRRAGIGAGAGSQPLRVALIAQSAVLIALVVTLAAVLTAPDRAAPVYTTLTSGETLPAGRYIRVVAHPDANRDSIDAIASGLELGIVEGPSERGVYTLVSPGASEAAWQTAASALESRPEILFVQPIAVGDDPP
jgi:anti-sigma factor RsiW